MVCVWQYLLVTGFLPKNFQPLNKRTITAIEPCVRGYGDHQLIFYLLIVKIAYMELNYLTKFHKSKMVILFYIWGYIIVLIKDLVNHLAKRSKSWCYFCINVKEINNLKNYLFFNYKFILKLIYNLLWFKWYIQIKCRK